MKKFPLILICILSLFLFQNCSSVKVIDSWKSDKVANVKDNNFIVVARTNNKQARIAFENEIVKQMEANGYKATASFSKFGALNPNAEKTADHENQIKAILAAEGFDAVVLTVMKDLKEETRIQQDGGYYAGGNYYGFYPRYYGGFYGYFYNPMAYHSLGNYVPETTTTTTSRLYVLETTVYDLTASGENQLVAVITSEIDNPQTASGAAEEYVKQISKRLNK